MSSVVLTGDTSGAGTITVPAVAGTFTATIGSATGTHYPFTAGTAVASTSGTSIDFTSIPSWVKRVTILFSAVSTNSSSYYLVQVGSGSVTTSGYASLGSNGGASSSSTAGFVVVTGAATWSVSGSMTINLISGNTYVSNHTFGNPIGGALYAMYGGGNVTLGGTLDRVRITTVNGTDTFDAGTINILYE